MQTDSGFHLFFTYPPEMVHAFKAIIVLFKEISVVETNAIVSDSNGYEFLDKIVLDKRVRTNICLSFSPIRRECIILIFIMFILEQCKCSQEGEVLNTINLENNTLVMTFYNYTK